MLFYKPGCAQGLLAFGGDSWPPLAGAHPLPASQGCLLSPWPCSGPLLCQAGPHPAHFSFRLGVEAEDVGGRRERWCLWTKGAVDCPQPTCQGNVLWKQVGAALIWEPQWEPGTVGGPEKPSELDAEG